MLNIKTIKTTVPNLEIENLTFSDHTVIIGPSGAGKTTLLRCIAGVQPCSGMITLDGKQLTSVGPERGISMAWQESRLLPNFTVKENILLGGDDSQFNEFTHLFKMNNLLGKYPHELSGGEAQRANILRAICSTSKVVLLDEPMQGIDPAVIRRIYKTLLYKMKKAGKIVISVTHELYQIYGLFDNVVAMRGGEVVVAGNLEATYDTPPTPWLANFFGPYIALSRKDLKEFDQHSNEDPCMVRPEWFKIKVPPFKRSHRLNATVTGVKWCGPNKRVSLVLNRTKKPLTVEVYADINDINTGEQVYVNFKKCSRPNWVISRAS